MSEERKKKLVSALIDYDTWYKLKIKCMKNDTSITKVLLDLVEKFVKEGEEA